MSYCQAVQLTHLYTYNELMLNVKWFSFPVGFKHIVKQTDITSNVYNEAKLPSMALC